MKYSITIADMEMNVVTEADAAVIEQIVGLVDRRMRDITQKSRSCSKVEAAILCALDFAGERGQLMDDKRTLEREVAENNKMIESLKAKLSEQKDEIDRLKNDNEVMHTILERAAATNKFTSGATAAEEGAPTSEPQVVENSEVKKEKNRNRVGNMFDLLTFGDV